MQQANGDSDLEPQTAGDNHPGGPVTLPSGGLVQDLAAIAAEDAASAGSFICHRLPVILGACMVRVQRECTRPGDPNSNCGCCVVRFWLVAGFFCLAVFLGLVEKIFCPPRIKPESVGETWDRPCVHNAVGGMIVAAVLLVLMSRLVQYVRKRRREYRARLARDMEMQGVQAREGGEDPA